MENTIYEAPKEEPKKETPDVIEPVDLTKED